MFYVRGWDMREILIEIINNYGYLGILLLIFVENIFPPIPSEVVLLFGGFLTLHTEMTAPAVIAVATLGSLLGAAVLYMAGRLITKKRLKRFVSSKAGSALHLKPSHVDIAGNVFVKYQAPAVLVCRCIPIVRSLISIPAGAARMNPPLFFVLTGIGSAIWNSAMVLLGTVLGDAWESGMPYLNKFTDAAVLLMAIVGLIVIFKLFRRDS